ncbi:MAG TPA: DNA polymerase III subunit beta [Tepidisphaeraceae bacterium]|nr:DNA polymerase III subunit beta [Tepidisphaeraceae bacterium]
MKVICNRGALLDALTVAGNVVATRTPKPALQCVKLAASGTQMTLSATDLEVAIRYQDNQVEVSEPGELLVPADKLRDIVRESTDDTLSIESAAEMAQVKGQDSLFRIYTQPLDTFPPVPEYNGEADFEIAGGQLKQLIGQTVFAAAKESTRYAFNGVLVNVKGKRLSLVSTDGRRLAEARGELISSKKTEKDILRAIVPVKALSLIDRLIDDPEEAVAFQISENQIIVHTPSATLTSTIVEGQFPPYEEVIPRDCDKKMVASTADFLSAIRRAALLTTEESKGIRLQFSKTGLVLSSQSPGAGEATINFPCKYEGADLEIGFNPIFLVEALKVVRDDEISFELSAANRPGLLKGGPDFQYVIMPVNIQ